MSSEQATDAIRYGRFLSSAAGALMVSAAVALIGYPAFGVEWFEPGDMPWREAMAYHGAMIPAWMLLVLGGCRLLVPQQSLIGSRAAVAKLAVIAAVLSLAGGFLIRTEGLSIGAVIQVAGMVFADIAGIATALILAATLSKGEQVGARLEYWAVLVSLSAVSLSTPLGHIAGAIKEFGETIPSFGFHARMLGVEMSEATNAYISSHSHQIVSAFLACALMLPLAAGNSNRRGWISVTLVFGIWITIMATVAQVGLYQFAAWSGWEPPVLFASELNGMPLDDLVLGILGIGMLLVLPALWTHEGNKSHFQIWRDRSIALSMMAFLAAVIGLGIYIEFHEGFFGGGDYASGAPGVLNDRCYIRGHLLFGCMLIPLIMSLLVNVTELRRMSLSVIIIAAVAGALGVFVWTFALSSLLLQIATTLSALSLAGTGYSMFKRRR